MARPSNPIPTYRLHKRTGRAIVTVRDHAGARREVLLPGRYNSPESVAEYDRIKAHIRANAGRMPAPAVTTSDLTIGELILRYMQERVVGYYVDPITNRPTSEQHCINHALRPVNRLFGTEPVSGFDSLKLDLARRAMITGAWLNDEERAARVKSKRPEGMARSTINKNVHRIRQMFRWAVRKKIIPAAMLTELEVVDSLERGRSDARETDPVLPVDVDTVETTLPHLPPYVADMVRVQLLTGARPGEVCSMRVRHLDMSGPVWTYKPEGHKTAWRGHVRTVAIGPRAQAILRKYTEPASGVVQLDAYVFSPRKQDAAIKAAKRAARKTRVQPSQLDRSTPGARRRPRDYFTVTGYNRAIARACERAGVQHWHAHQLRHTAALLIAREHGLEAARAALGHRTVNMSAHYAGVDFQRAAEVAANIG
jgi:integrase